MWGSWTRQGCGWRCEFPCLCPEYRRGTGGAGPGGWGLGMPSGPGEAGDITRVGAHHISLALTPEGEPGADGAAGKEVLLGWACPVPVGMLLLAPRLSPTPLGSFSNRSLCRLSLDRYVGSWCPCGSGGRSWGLGSEDESKTCFSLLFKYHVPGQKETIVIINSRQTSPRHQFLPGPPICRREALSF